LQDKHNIHTLLENIKFICTHCEKRTEKFVKGSLFYLFLELVQINIIFCYNIYSQTCLSDPLYITTSFVSRPYLFLPCVFPCIQPLYNDPLSNATNDRVLWVNILHITTIRGLLSNRKLDNIHSPDFGNMSVLPS
jgi:hypothetical protein